MEIILLIVPDFNLRQLYHELLLSKNIEIVPTNTIENAVLILTLTPVHTAILYVDDTNKQDVETFLSLRKHYHKWITVRIVLLCLEGTLSHPNLTEKDMLVPIEQLTPEEVSEKIKEVVKNSS